MSSPAVQFIYLEELPRYTTEALRKAGEDLRTVDWNEEQGLRHSWVHFLDGRIRGLWDTLSNEQRAVVYELAERFASQDRGY